MIKYSHSCDGEIWVSGLTPGRPIKGLVHVFTDDMHITYVTYDFVFRNVYWQDSEHLSMIDEFEIPEIVKEIYKQAYRIGIAAEMSRLVLADANCP